MAEKIHINLVFIGHVDAGKSTSVGRLLFDTGAIDEQAMRKLKEKAQELGKSGFEFAFVMDNLKEEREQILKLGILPKEGKDAFRRILGSSFPHVVVSTQDFLHRMELWQ